MLNLITLFVLKLIFELFFVQVLGQVFFVIQFKHNTFHQIDPVFYTSELMLCALLWHMLERQFGVLNRQIRIHIA